MLPKTCRQKASAYLLERHGACRMVKSLDVVSARELCGSSEEGWSGRRWGHWQRCKPLISSGKRNKRPSQCPSQETGPGSRVYGTGERRRDLLSLRCLIRAVSQERNWWLEGSLAELLDFGRGQGAFNQKGVYCKPPPIETRPRDPLLRWRDSGKASAIAAMAKQMVK